MKLYRMNATLDKIESHEVTDGCLPQIVDRFQYGTLYRCRTNRHDHYGYMKRYEAKLEAKQLVHQEMTRLRELLKQLGSEET